MSNCNPTKIRPSLLLLAGQWRQPLECQFIDHLWCSTVLVPKQLNCTFSQYSWQINKYNEMGCVKRKGSYTDFLDFISWHLKHLRHTQMRMGAATTQAIRDLFTLHNYNEIYLSFCLLPLRLSWRPGQLAWYRWLWASYWLKLKHMCKNMVGFRLKKTFVH